MSSGLVEIMIHNDDLKPNRKYTGSTGSTPEPTKIEKQMFYLEYFDQLASTLLSLGRQEWGGHPPRENSPCAR